MDRERQLRDTDRKLRRQTGRQTADRHTRRQIDRKRQAGITAVRHTRR